MNGFVGSQFGFVSALTEENLVQLPTNFYVDFVPSTSQNMKKLENTTPISEYPSTKTTTTNIKTENGNYQNFLDLEPIESEILFSPNSIPFSFSQNDFFNDPQLLTDQQFSCNRKRVHSKIEQPTILFPQNNESINLPIIQIKKEKTFNKFESKKTSNINTNISTIANTNTKISTNTNTNTNTTTTTNTNPNTNTNTSPNTNTTTNNIFIKKIDTVLFDEIIIAGDIPRSQLKLLSEEQKKRRKVLKNRISAAKCYTKIKQKITNLDKKVSNLKETKKFLTNKIGIAQNERKMLISKQDELKNEIKQLMESGQQIGERTGHVIESLCDNLYNFGQIPAKENEVAETSNTSEKSTNDDEKSRNKKKKTAKNPNTKTGFVMMIMIIAVSLVFANEVLFGNPTSHSNALISKQPIFKKRGLNTMPNNQHSKSKDKFTNNQIIWIEEIEDSEKQDRESSNPEKNVNPNINENGKVETIIQPFTLDSSRKGANRKTPYHSINNFYNKRSI
ncbi:mansc domain containing protein [Anaeramoeba flamelloides]|uniref:Mansc domain containing protein n=1 Tax=Anaeramoeba flamelloides TaxID=1746091 RepID=A0ABQ8XJG8_9EUKA|nr:mansc domain containing protein [Anaeramoeba flamelloides]